MPFVGSDCNCTNLDKVIRIFCLAAILVLLVLGFRPETSLPDAPYTEDGFYALSVAWHSSNSHWSTIDGENLTNGYQPLQVGIYSFLFSFTDNKFTGLRIIFLFEWLVWICTAFLFGILLERLAGSFGESWTRWLGFLIWISAVHLFRQHFNGLETGLLLCLYLGTVNILANENETGKANPMLAGILFGVLFLARIDSAFFFIAWLLFRSIPFQKKVLKENVISLVLFALFAMPWLIFNQLYFGSFIPTSGMAQTELAFKPERFGVMISALGQVLFPHFYGWKLEHEIIGWADALRWILVLGLVYWIIRTRNSQLILRDKWRVIGLSFGLAGLGWMLFYGISSDAWYFYSRYLIPLSIPALGALGLWINAIFRRFWIFRAFVTPLFIFPSVILTWMMFKGSAIGGNPHYRQQLPLILQNVPEGERVGAPQSGTIGFFRDGIVNLDGKVNREAMKAGSEGKVGDYLISNHVRWFCDNEEQAAAYLGWPDQPSSGWVLVDRKGDFVLLRSTMKDSIPAQ